MSRKGEEVAARARALVGVRFRPQGRSPERGLDCVGVAALATKVPLDRVPRGYATRGQHLPEIACKLHSLGLRQVSSGMQETGDVVVMELGPMQLHLGVLTSQGIVHADAGLGRVVERPGKAPWPIKEIWRIPEED